MVYFHHTPRGANSDATLLHRARTIGSFWLAGMVLGRNGMESGMSLEWSFPFQCLVLLKNQSSNRILIPILAFGMPERCPEWNKIYIKLTKIPLVPLDTSTKNSKPDPESPPNICHRFSFSTGESLGPPPSASTSYSPTSPNPR
eukprot:TRINITY_DN10926_c0_g5_i1.p1 TRINITY_DN10926_c0_g5~~TRINITY_DN10926_c0_g5_i1.p1  ORF type:complete len:144 (-),score=10.22 TRINITY_DN10926_c0_g5_i1:50-481(-)